VQEIEKNRDFGNLINYNIVVNVKKENKLMKIKEKQHSGFPLGININRSKTSNRYIDSRRQNSWTNLE